ncbi:MAG: hypothetical protein JWO54_460 [Candidatus Saccharibacteria bacterium]|nr:hypothetical protein [Candidatus Saccharibacteria bacterium]
MTMAHQNEAQPTLTRSEQSTPESTLEHEISHQQVAFLLDSMFDEYVAALRNPDLEFKYESGIEKAEITEDNPRGLPTITYTTISRDEILDMKRQDLLLYAKGTLSRDLQQINPVTSEPVQAYVNDSVYEAFVEEGILHAEKRLKNPAHITVGEVNTTENNRFVDVINKSMRDLGSGAIHLIEIAESIFSRPIAIAPSQDEQRFYEAIPGHPADPELLKGDVLTLAINQAPYIEEK